MIEIALVYAKLSSLGNQCPHPIHLGMVYTGVRQLLAHAFLLFRPRRDAQKMAVELFPCRD